MSEHEPSFAYIWEYVVKNDYLERFRSMYGPQGEWVQLFSHAEGYVRTELLRDIDNPDRFFTIDYWVSREALDRFREQYAREFAALDEACKALTVEERFVGDFDLHNVAVNS